MPEIDLGDPSSLAVYLALHQTEPEPEPDHEEPPASEQAHEAVPGEDQSEPAQSAQEAVCPGLGRSWVHAFLDGLAVLHTVGYCLLLLYAAWH